MSYAPPPLTLPTSPVISIISPWCSYHGPVSNGETAPSSLTGNAANEALYFPFIVTTTTIFQRGFWWNGSVATNAGNVAVGIYDEAQARQATTGAVAASGNSVIQTAAFTANYTAAPGVYYMAISFSASGLNSTTAYAANLSRARFAGLYRQAVGSHPLPATATFATWTSQVIPFFGIAATSFAI